MGLEGAAGEESMSGKLRECLWNEVAKKGGKIHAKHTALTAYFTSAYARNVQVTYYHKAHAT